MSRCLVILDCQPTTIDQYVAVKQTLTEFDKVTLYIIDRPLVMQTKKVLKLWFMLLSEYPDVIIKSTTEDFTKISMLPEDVSDVDMVKVQDMNFYVHIGILGIPVELLGHIRGYNQMFMRVAFRQGLARDYLRRYID